MQRHWQWKVVMFLLSLIIASRISATSISLLDHCRGSTIFPASFAACGRRWYHLYKRAKARASWFHPPIMATILPVICSPAYIVLWFFASAIKSSTPALLAIYFTSKRVITSHHFSPFYAHFSQTLKNLDARFNNVLQLNPPFITAFCTATSRVPRFGQPALPFRIFLLPPERYCRYPLPSL